MSHYAIGKQKKGKGAPTRKKLQKARAQEANRKMRENQQRSDLRRQGASAAVGAAFEKAEKRDKRSER